MANRSIRLTLRAFNNECDAAVANARWNNVNAMEKRIINGQAQIDKLNESNATIIARVYLRLNLQELYFNTEEDEERYKRLLAKAKAEAESVVGPQLDAFNDQVRMLERDLADAQAKVLRAQAIAERTRSGYVYIISNVGSFGDDVVKIGLTRRLDPTDRVRELGDASVTFAFDTHAIIYSEDAPTLERALHAEFEPVRVNAQNYRKEFFRAKLDDVELAVKKLSPSAPFFKDIEAQDFRETLAKRKSALLAMGTSPTVGYPATI